MLLSDAPKEQLKELQLVLWTAMALVLRTELHSAMVLVLQLAMV